MVKAGSNLLYVVFFFLFIITAVQLVLSTRKNSFLGLIIPFSFLVLAGYNLYKSIYVYNPYPTMEEGMLMAFGLIGFVISITPYIVCRVILKFRKR